MVGNWNWCEVTHNTFSWGALSCQAWVDIICHPVVEIGNVAYSAKYGCIRPGDLIVIKSHCDTSQQHVLVLNHCFCPMKYDWSRELSRHFRLVYLTTEWQEPNWYCPDIFLDCVLFMFAFGPAPLTHCCCHYIAITLPCERHMLPSNSH